jgi:hypothetical protein
MKFIAYGLILLFMMTSSLSAADNARCYLCHGRKDFQVTLESGRTLSLYVDSLEFRASIHGRRPCTDCHTDISAIPHPKFPQPVVCVRCHYVGNPVGAPNLTTYQDYKESVHGKAREAGNTKAPVCQDCHGSHNIRPHTDTTSTIYKVHVPQTCGRCHLEVYTKYEDGVHGQALARGAMDSPSCVDCHGEHNIFPPTDPRSSVYPTNVARTCPKCHQAKALMARNGVPTEQVQTYQESFHGVAIKFGVKTVANCASCHGYHDILPSMDTRSSINLANLPGTCGKCHPGAGANFARGKIHVDPRSKGSGSIYWVSLFFKWLTTIVILGLVGHIILDLLRRRRSAREAKADKDN